MKRMLILAIAAVAMVFTTSTDASAQSYNNGYAFGTGVGQAFCGGFGGSRFAAPPYFAQHPPVYYSGIVRRPYGISPFAAPPGIEPVEIRRQNYAPRPVTIKNPYFNSTAPASGPAIKAESNGEKSKVNKST
jgi:hypothetical protein